MRLNFNIYNLFFGTRANKHYGYITNIILN